MIFWRSIPIIARPSVEQLDTENPTLFNQIIYVHMQEREREEGRERDIKIVHKVPSINTSAI